MNLSLFALRENPYFETGTLFDLPDSGLLHLPDRGDGEPASIQRKDAVLCPPLDINVPPGHCGVKTTSISLPGAGLQASDVSLEQSIHTQLLIVPVETLELTEVIVRDRRRDTEIDEYVSPRITADGNYEVYIQHLGPGFYEAVFKTADNATGRMTFIKFYPQHIADGFAYLLEESDRAENQEVPIKSTPLHIRYHGEYTADLLNTALELVTEWGENYRKPIDERILRSYPDLTSEEIAELSKLSNDAEYYIYSLGEKELDGELSEAEIALEAKRKYPWINDNNLYRLKNIAMYYARR